VRDDRRERDREFRRRRERRDTRHVDQRANAEAIYPLSEIMKMETHRFRCITGCAACARRGFLALMPETLP
jgi:hypothetical protein